MRNDAPKTYIETVQFHAPYCIPEFQINLDRQPSTTYHLLSTHVSFRLIIAAFLHHWRMNLAVAAGAAVGTAVLTGALLVGDSMRGSLRHLALDRLGRIDEALLADRFFRAQLADELVQAQDADKMISAAVPAIILSASMENPGTYAAASGKSRAAYRLRSAILAIGLQIHTPAPLLQTLGKSCSIVPWPKNLPLNRAMK